VGRKRYITNREIAELLKRVKAAYEVKGGNRFRIRAYENAAVSIEHSTSEIKDLWDEGKLDQIPGVGSNMASYLDELFRTGKVKHFEEIMKDLPPAMFVFEKIPGVGAKRALSLARNLNIVEEKDALSKLKKAAMSGQIREIEGFGEKLENELLLNIKALERGEIKETRMPLFIAYALAEEIIDYLKKSPEVIEADPLGSLRRMLPTVGDIDIAVSTKNPKAALDYFFKFHKIKKIVSRGEESLGRVILNSGQQVDIRLSSPEKYGSMLQYFTGSKQHNIALREYALSKGMSLSEYGIKFLKTGRILNAKTEFDFYKALGMAWIPPEIRENSGEIEAAIRSAMGKSDGLPKLVELRDIKGDLHLHSNFPIEPSHDIGVSSLEEMVLKAKNLGYHYLGFSEHNPSISQHSKKEIIKILKTKKEVIDQINYSLMSKKDSRVNKLPIKIFNSLEIDIAPSGELNIPEEGFEFLDYAIVSVHTSMNLSKEKMTERIIKGLSHPKAKILGHPTGRKIGSREGYEANWDKIFDFCLKNKKILEVSAWPDRLDLPDFLIKEAVARGVKIVINSDSHEVSQMELMKYGVATARRGWAEKKDVINTLPLDEISDILL